LKNILTSLKDSIDSSNKTRTLIVIVSILLMASMVLGFIPVHAQQATGTETTHGETPSTNGYIGPITNADPITGQPANYTVNPIAFLSVSPNPIGVNQMLLVNMWITFPSGEGKFMNGYLVTINHPDGTSGTVPLQSYVADGTAWFDYVPTETGTYQFQLSFPGEYYPAGYYNNGNYSKTFVAGWIYNPSDYVDAAKSDWENLTVQQTQVASWDGLEYNAGNALPSGYWSHPIEPNNRNWYQVAGNFPFYESNIGQLAATNSWHDEWYGPFVPAVNTAHIMWSQVGALSGVIGGEEGTQSNVVSPSSFSTPSVIYMGRCYSTVTKVMQTLINGTYRQQPVSVAECYDLQTGKVYYDIPTADGGVTPTYIMYWPGVDTSVPGSEADAAATVDIGTISGSGASARLYRIAPMTGAITLNASIPNVLGALGIPNFYFYNGYFLSFQETSTTNSVYDGVAVTLAYNGYMLNWTEQGSATSAAFFNTVANGGRLVGNVSVTLPESYRTLYEPNFGYGYGAYDPVTGISITENRFIYGGFFGSSWQATSFVNSSYPIGGSATVLWNISTPNSQDYMQDAYRPTNGWCRDGIYACEMERGFIQARSEFTGQILWNTTTESAVTGQSYPWGEFWMYDEAAYGFGTNTLLYAVGYAGTYALNESTGAIVWQYNDPAPPFETPYTSLENGTYVNEYSVQDIRVLGTGGPDGIVYVSNNEHTPTLPPERGWGLMALNATTGQLLWKVYGTRMSVAGASDGYVMTNSNYDGKVYALGKGPSAITVSVPQTAITANTPVLISGTAQDLSPQQPGTALISDATMATWMDYLNMQMPIGGIYSNVTVTGVPITINAVDPTGKLVNIGTATSNIAGTYHFTWTPTTAGTWQISAVFAGSNSYGWSSAETAAVVVNAPTPTVTPTPTASPASQFATTTDLATWIIVAIVVIVIAIAIVGVTE